MAPVDNTFPQDKGQGLSEGDHNDAASVAQSVFDPTLKDTVVKGLDLVNLGSGSFDVSFGVAKVYVPSMQTKDWGNGQEVRDECLVTQQVQKRSGISYVGTGTTHVFIQIDLSQDDNVSIITNGDGAQPAEPSMKLGKIDEATNTANLVNRKLNGDYEILTAEQASVSTAPSNSNDVARLADLLDVEDTDGSPVVSGVAAMQAGTSLDFSPDNDGTVTLNYTGQTTADKQAMTTHPVAISELAGGDFVDYPIRVPSGKSVKVWKWGLRTDGQTTPAGLQVGLYDYDAAAYVQYASTAYATGSPLASHSGAGDLALRLENTTSSTTYNAGADFSATIE